MAAPTTTMGDQHSITSSAQAATVAFLIEPDEGCSPAQANLGFEDPQKDQFKDLKLPDQTIVDATTAVWTGVDDYPIRIGGGTAGCWFGGVIQGTYPDTDSWDRLHDTAAFSFLMPNFHAIGIRVDNYGDAFNIVDFSTDFTIRQAHLTYIRDDCVENDRLLSGVVEDSLLDGCYTAFSARAPAGDTVSDGQGNLWTIRNSLIRLQPMPTVYKGTAPGHGGFFKWDKTGRAPNLSLHDNIFRVDQHPNGGTLTTPGSYLTSCSNNIVVWLGAGPYPDSLPDCFTVTTDKSIWDDAVADWKAKYGIYD
jgi:hypothetical protein